MDISLLNILRTVSWDFRRDMAQSYANALKKAIEIHVDNDVEKREGFFLSKKGVVSKDAKKSIAGNFEDQLYVGNIHSAENHLFYNDIELAEDDQIINVVYVDGPITRDGGACSYGSKDWRDQVIYADTIKQVIGHLFIINTPGGESAARNDYEMMMNDWRKNGKYAVAFVDGMCCSSGINISSRCDRTIVMNKDDEVGCIGSMAAFWATPDGAIDQTGTRYVEIVGNECPDKNGWWRDAAKGDYEKLQALISQDTNEFHQTVRENRPLVEDWMLTGDTYKAKEVMSALVDEIGNMDRAIECLLELANGQLTPARFAKKEDGVVKSAEPDKADPDNGPEAEPEVPMGPEDAPEVSLKHNNMKDEEKKAKQNPSAAEESKAEPAKGKDEPEKKNPNEEPDGNKPNENPDGENPNDEPDGENPDGENPDGENPDGENPDGENPDGEEPDEPDDDPDGNEPDDDPDGNEPDDDPEDDPKKKKGEKPAEKCGGGEPKKKEGEDASKVQDAAKAMKEKDSQIAELKAAFDKAQKENAKLKKKIGDLSNEVKELSAEPTPMADSNAGIPASNETGAQPKFQKRITRGMSYEEVRAARKEREKEKQEAKTNAKK